MSEIPDDIRNLALAVVDRGYNVGLIDAVAEALMQERERCAAMLERKVAQMRGSPTGDMMARIFEAGAAEIRSQTP